MGFHDQVRKDSIGFKTKSDCELMYLNHVLMISRLNNYINECETLCEIAGEHGLAD